MLCDELRSATSGVCPIRFHTENSLAGAVSDESLLRHIVVNLLSNAVKYSEPGSPVSVTARRDGSDLVLAISDEGIGIPQADQAGLFESFTRASNVGIRPGTGLGLVVVRRSVEAHGGSVELVSSPGEGNDGDGAVARFSRGIVRYDYCTFVIRHRGSRHEPT
jgi:signal transduction histidine kinase